ncbi:MAG TPA: hypothetical protein VG755_35190, partial [Nannocystaceae bacterium]|nr:hypothetical protein [Nannocystaceae bacterium]
SAAPSQTPTRASVRAPIRRADAPVQSPTQNAVEPAPAANAPTTDATPRIAATTEPTATVPTIERATTPSATTPTLDAAPQHDAAPELAAATRTPAATPAHESRASAPITHEPVTISRAEDLATAIERLRPIPKGGAVIEVQTPNLGKLRLEVAMDDGNVRIRIDSDDSRALAWIENEQHGITAAARQSLPEANNVQLELRQQAGDGRHRAPQRSHEPAEARGDASASPPQRSTDRSAPASTPTIRRGLVDVVA